MFPSADTSACSPLPSSGFRGRPLREPCGSPPSQVLWVRKTARPSFPFASGFPWPTVPPMLRRRRGALLRSEEHTSELQSHLNLVSRLLLETNKSKPHTRETRLHLPPPDSQTTARLAPAPYH